VFASYAVPQMTASWPVQELTTAVTMICGARGRGGQVSVDESHAAASPGASGCGPVTDVVLIRSSAAPVHVLMPLPSSIGPAGIERRVSVVRGGVAVWGEL